MGNRRANRLLRNSLFIGLLAIFAGCESYYYDAEQPLAAGQWSYQDSIVFEFDIQDKTKLYDVFLDVKHTDEYRFANLYVMLHVYFPDGRSRKEQVSLELADPSGKWLGKCSGKQCTRELPFMPNALFEMEGKHRIVLEQYNRQSAMEGVEGFRMRIRQREKDAQPN